MVANDAMRCIRVLQASFNLVALGKESTPRSIALSSSL